MSEPLLKVEGLVKHFPVKGGILGRTVDKVHAVDGVSFSLQAGETLGVVGESGCGKSTTGRCILRLIEPTAGTVWFEGKNVTAMGKTELRAMARDMQIIFQDPYASLNPRMTVQAIIGEALTIHKLAPDPAAYEARIVDLLETVGLSADHLRRYPHEFSGGQRQRVAIARSLASNADFIVCDEPTSALDVSVQAQILNLMRDLQEKFGLTYLFISHNLAVVRHMATRIGVMYLGRLVEVSDAKEMFTHPRHPYTRMLLDAVPDLAMSGRARIPVAGEIPNPITPPTGCTFHPRCPLANERCKAENPLPINGVACHAVVEGRTLAHPVAA